MAGEDGTIQSEAAPIEKEKVQSATCATGTCIGGAPPGPPPDGPPSGAPPAAKKRRSSSSAARTKPPHGSDLALPPAFNDDGSTALNTSGPPVGRVSLGGMAGGSLPKESQPKQQKRGKSLPNASTKPLISSVNRISQQRCGGDAFPPGASSIAIDAVVMKSSLLDDDQCLGLETDLVALARSDAPTESPPAPVLPMSAMLSTGVVPQSVCSIFMTVAERRQARAEEVSSDHDGKYMFFIVNKAAR